ncbi:MAG TPA: DUF2249 domain-containing protein [Ktedonobacterales bacterium]
MHNTSDLYPQHTTTLDVRPDLARGDEPFERIINAAVSVAPGDQLILIAPFEPVPLYAVLEGYGFTHESERRAADEWAITFTRQA